MKRLLILFLLLGLAHPVNAFWGSTEEEKNICRNRAKGERNEFSAKQTYKYCLKNLKKERELKAKEEKLQIQKAKKLKKSCEKKVKEFGFDKKLQIQKKSTDEYLSLSKEQLKKYEKGYYKNNNYYVYGYRYLLEKYGATALRYDDDYINYLKDGCDELK